MARFLTLTATSPVQTFAEVLTVAEVEHFLGLPSLSPEDSERTALLNALITGAREQAEILQNRELVRKQQDLSLDGFEATEIELRGPLVSVDLVKYRNNDGNWTTLAETTDYIVDTSKQPGLIRPPYGGSWPTFTAWPTSAVLVRFTAGYSASDAFWSDAGARIKVGMKMLISAWFNNRLPFEIGASAIQVYPFTAGLLEKGAVPRIA